MDDKQDLSQLLGQLLSFDPEVAITELTRRLRRLQRRLATNDAENSLVEENHED